MLRKSAYTQLRSNLVVETDGETGGQPEELMVFPTTSLERISCSNHKSRVPTKLLDGSVVTFNSLRELNAAD
jgi:hypothetical protein